MQGGTKEWHFEKNVYGLKMAKIVSFPLSGKGGGDEYFLGALKGGNEIYHISEGEGANDFYSMSDTKEDPLWALF